MRNSVLILLSLCLLAVSPASGQRAAERYIPIGKSPGLSGKVTYMGAIGRADTKARTVAGKSWNASVTERTRIWVDRTKLRKSSVVGTFADLKPGAIVEVKYEGLERGRHSGQAEWIKVEAAPPPEK